jgi:hypothetical protein
MTKELYVPAPKIDLPRKGQHSARLADFSDLPNQPNPFPPYKPKHQVLLDLEITDENDPITNQPLRIHDRVTLTRHKDGNLIEYITALSHPDPITQDSWKLSQYIGRSCGLDIVHSVKPEATYPNIERVYALPDSYRPMPAQPSASAEIQTKTKDAASETGQSAAQEDFAQVSLG